MQQSQAGLQKFSYGPILVLTAIHALLANSYKSFNLGGAGLAGVASRNEPAFSPWCVGLVYRVNLLPCYAQGVAFTRGLPAFICAAAAAAMPCGLFLSDKFR